jgi:hypothetical protein
MAALDRRVRQHTDRVAPPMPAGQAISWPPAKDRGRAPIGAHYVTGRGDHTDPGGGVRVGGQHGTQC